MKKWVMPKIIFGFWKKEDKEARMKRIEANTKISRKQKKDERLDNKPYAEA